MRLPSFGLPRAVLPVFWGILLIEACYGAYLGVWPLWIERLGAPVWLVGLLLGAGGFLRIFIMAPSASISDRLGTRRLLLLSRLAILAGYMVAFVATHWSLLLVTVVAGAAAEVAFPVTQSYVARHCTEDQRMRAFAVIFTIGPSFALALGPIVSGVVVALWGIRAAFALAAAFCVLSILAFMRMERDDHGSISGHAVESSYREALAQGSVRQLLGLQFAMVFALSLGVALIPTFLEDVQGVNDATIATLSAFAAVGSAVFGLVVARKASIQKRPFLGVAAATAQAAVGLVFFHQFAQIPMLSLAFFLRGGLFSGWALMAAAVGSFSSPIHRARAYASSEMIGGIAFSFGPIVAGQLYPMRPTLPFEVAIALSLLLIPVLLVTQRRHDRAASLLPSREAAAKA